MFNRSNYFEKISNNLIFFIIELTIFKPFTLFIHAYLLVSATPTNPQTVDCVSLFFRLPESEVMGLNRQIFALFSLFW